MLGVTMLGQTAPAPVRAGLWLAPAAAAATGITVADTVREAVVYAITPMAMSAAAEGTAFIARRVVVYRTGADTAALRRNAAAVQRLAYHQARAASHPSSYARKRSERISWRLAKRIGIGDTELGADLIQVQRERLRHGADTALSDMLTVSPAPPAPAPARQHGTPPPRYCGAASPRWIPLMRSASPTMRIPTCRPRNSPRSSSATASSSTPYRSPSSSTAPAPHHPRPRRQRRCAS